MKAGLFEQAGRAITSLGAVIFVLVLVVTAMVFFSHTLFLHALPEAMARWERFMAAWTLAIGWEATVLITTVNTHHLHKRVPILMALCSGVIMLFFIQAFDSSQPNLVIIQRWFVGLLVAYLNFAYSELFVKKWNEFIALNETPTKLIESQSSVNQLRSELNEARSELNQLHDLRQFQSNIVKQLTCPHCKQHFETFGSLHAHKGYCTENPRKRKAI